MNRLFALLVCASSLAGCRDGEPIVQEMTRVASPDSQWEAILEQVDNGLGFGQGMAYHEIHIQPVGSRVTYHGDESASLVFYIEVTSEPPPRLEWAGQRRLVVAHSAAVTPGRQLERYMDVDIQYEPRPKTQLE